MHKYFGTTYIWSVQQKTVHCVHFLFDMLDTLGNMHFREKIGTLAQSKQSALTIIFLAF